jgi:tryptophan synthase alpha chain
LVRSKAARPDIAMPQLPIAVGFGISLPGHVSVLGGLADAAVVGSALVSVIAESGARADGIDRVQEYVRWLKSGAPEPAPRA